ncbi:YfbU family protein [Kordia sp. TARA_039_SRF]|nr:YfbU family protein [Kordia sp. TARA_039_SRF]
MKLDTKERLSLSFQLKILEKLYPEEAEYYANHRKAIEDGYELHYSWLTEHLSDGLTSDECTEVLDILDMYTGLYYSFQALKDPKELTIESVRFPGFDGNNEIMRMAYTKYFIEDLDRFEWIKKLTNGYYNSHMRMIPKYQKMLSRFKDYSIEERHSLNEGQIKELIETTGY